jgi:hypothetical protein
MAIWILSSVNHYRFGSTTVYRMNLARPERGEYEVFLETEPQPPLPPPRIPGPAKKAIVVAVLLCVLGCVCLGLFLATFSENSVMSTNRSSRWPLFVFGLLSLPSGFYTLYLGRLIYRRTPGYYWPMIFL